MVKNLLCAAPPTSLPFYLAKLELNPTLYTRAATLSALSLLIGIETAAGTIDRAEPGSVCQ